MLVSVFSIILWRGAALVEVQAVLLGAEPNPPHLINKPKKIEGLSCLWQSMRHFVLFLHFSTLISQGKLSFNAF